MISFFRLNDPLRFAFGVIIFLAIRIPLLFDEIIYLDALQGFQIGEKLSSGAVLYRDLWHFIAPITASFYWFIDLFFGKNLLVYSIIAIVLSVIQAYWFNSICLKNNLYNEKTYLPAFFYLILLNWTSETTVLSAELISLTVLLYIIQLIIEVDRHGNDEENFLKIGFLFSIAFLINQPLIWFFIVIFLGLAFTRTLSPQKMIVFSFGVFAPILAFYSYYYIFDTHDNFISFVFINYFSSVPDIQLSTGDLFEILFIPSIIFLISFYTFAKSRGYINFQVVVQRIFFVWTVVAVLILFASKRLNSNTLLYFVIPFTFYLVHFFLLIKDKYFRTVIAYCVLIFHIGLVYIHRVEDKWVDYITKIEFSKTYFQISSITFQLKGEEILVLGDNYIQYGFNKVATPFYNWQIAEEKLFYDLNSYDRIVKIEKLIIDNRPNYIVDRNKVFPKLIAKIPHLGKIYLPSKQFSNVFERKEVVK